MEKPAVKTRSFQQQNNTNYTTIKRNAYFKMALVPASQMLKISVYLPIFVFVLHTKIMSLFLDMV